MSAKPLKYTCPICESKQEIMFRPKDGKVYCAECAAVMKEEAEAEVVLSPRFLEARVKVEARIKEKSLAEAAVVYQRKVLSHLLECGEFFKEDFVDEVNKPSELNKFLGVTKRPTDADKVCVDNALTAVGYAFPATLPRGEKFTFEVPCIMETAGWTFMNGPGDIFKTKFTALADAVEANTMYLICAKQVSNKIGHMVVITTAGDKTAYLTDAQKQPNNYGVYMYVGWRYGAVPASRPKPYRKINLATGRFDGDWVS